MKNELSDYQRLDKSEVLSYYKKGFFILSTEAKELKPFEAQRIDHIRNKRDINDSINNLFLNHFISNKEIKRKTGV